jgi:iron complex outermembrane recepter protein
MRYDPARTCTALLLAWSFAGIAPATTHADALPDAVEQEAGRTEVPEASTAEPIVTGDWENDFSDLSLEELMDIEVISVTRAEGQNLFSSPAAIHVITEEDIRRSGHQQLPELLRLVPGIHVARMDANKWAIAARGANGRYNRLQLVQMDGRTLYTPAFSGVSWITQDAILADLDRLEIIRGPGASLWGANALNGIINIVSKPASETQGFFLKAVGGTREGGIAALRYGGAIDDDAHYRVYLKGQSHGDFDPAGYSDDWQRYQAGFRADFALAGEDSLTIQGDVFDLSAGEALNTVNLTTGVTRGIADNHQHRGANILARWTHSLEDSEMQLQAYYDWTHWIIPYPGADYDQQLGLLDIDFHHSLVASAAHQLVWGLNYRHLSTDITPGGSIAVVDGDITQQTISGFLQDTITLIPDELTLILGTKLEHNELTHFEYQPSLRLAYQLHPDHVVWAAVSRAVRVPSLVERYGDLTLAAAGPGLPVRLLHNSDFQSETLIAYELGYRTRALENVSLDVAAFANRFDNVQTFRQVSPLDLEFSNEENGEAFGVEASLTWQAAENWRLVGNYSYVTLQLHGLDETAEGDSPENLASLQSYLDLSDDLELNAALYYADNVPHMDVGAYTRLDVGLTWRPSANVSLSIWGQNLLDESHPEHGPDDYLSRQSAEVKRAVLGELKIEF